MTADIDDTKNPNEAAAQPSQCCDLLFAGTSTSDSKENDALTIDMLNEAVDLIKALAPPEAPQGEIAVLGQTGLRIIKNDMIPENTVMVSKRLFDMIYAASK